MKRVFAISAIGLALLFLVISIQEAKQYLSYRPYEQILTAAQQDHEKGNLEEAEKKLLGLEETKPAEPAASIELSYVYEDMGNLDLAFKKAQDALGKSKNALTQRSLFLNRFKISAWRDNLEERVRYLPLAIQGQNAVKLWGSGDQWGALLALQNLIEKYPGAYQPHAALSLLYKNTGDNEKALQEAEQALKIIDSDLKSEKLSPRMRLLTEDDRNQMEDLSAEIRTIYDET